MALFAGRFRTKQKTLPPHGKQGLTGNVWFVDSGSVLLPSRKATLANADSLHAVHRLGDKPERIGVLMFKQTHRRGMRMTGNGEVVKISEFVGAVVGAVCDRPCRASSRRLLLEILILILILPETDQDQDQEPEQECVNAVPTVPYAKTSVITLPSAAATGRFVAVRISLCGSRPIAWKIVAATSSGRTGFSAG
jgi:hypothetical protein